MTYKLLILLFGLAIAALWTLKILKAIREKENNQCPYKVDVEKNREVLR